MAYIGTPPSNAFTSLLKQDFSTSATTGYTLDHAVNNANDIALFINFVRQEPTAGYAASGTTLTLTSATASSDDMYCVYLGQALQTVNPPNASVGISQLSATGTKDSTTFLRGDNTFASAGGDNTPAFSAYFTSSQTIPTTTWTKINFGNELFDTDSCFDSTTNMRFTPTVAGKYSLHGHVNYDGSNGGAFILCAIYKNGSQIFSNGFGANNPCTLSNSANSAQFSIIVDANGSSDYFEVYGQHNHGSDRSVFVGNFYGSKIIT